MTPSPYTPRPWMRAVERRRDRHAQHQRQQAVGSAGFLVSAVLALGLAFLAAVLTR